MENKEINIPENTLFTMGGNWYTWNYQKDKKGNKKSMIELIVKSHHIPDNEFTITTKKILPTH